MATTSYDVAPLDPYAERITSGIAMLGGVLMLPTLFLYLSGFLLTGVGVTGAVITAAVAPRAGGLAGAELRGAADQLYDRDRSRAHPTTLGARDAGSVQRYLGRLNRSGAGRYAALWAAALV